MSGALWTAEEIAAATGGRVSDAWSVAGVSIDSRTVQPGELFVALRGPTHDGHDFVAAALKRGAAALIDHLPGDVPATAPLIVVDDTMAALTALGVAARARSRARVLAVTGSVGKTGVKEALKLALGEQAPTHASAASHNNHWGVPLSLARAPHDAAYALYELGMNAPGEIATLTRLVRPHVALITAIEAAHVGRLGSIEAIAEAKAEIFQGLAPDGVAVLNVDTMHADRLRAHAEAAGCTRVIGFGTAPGADARLVDERLDAEGSDVVMTLDGREIRYRVGVPGHHWVINSLAVVAGAAALGADPEGAARALAGFEAPSGRGRRHRIRWGRGELTLIDESYNANPASMRAALGLLRGVPGRTLVALGDMLELGEHAPELHAGLAEAVAEVGAERVFTAGPLMRHLFDALPEALRGAHAEDPGELRRHLAAELRPGDTLLVKGSLGSRMTTIVEALVAAERKAPASTSGRREG